MPRLERKHAPATRIFHWANVPILAVMIYSGLLIYWANAVYAIRLGGITLVPFFPDWFYEALNLDHRLAEGMAWHFAFMWLFAINGLLYVGYTFWSGEWRELLPDRRTLGEAWQVVLHDLGLRSRPLPPRKFNGAQRLAYTGVIAMGAGSLLTGLAIYKPVQLGWLTAMLGGYPAARLEHFALTVGYVLFFVIHITQVIRAGWNNFRAMVIGVEVVPDREPSPEVNGEAGTRPAVPEFAHQSPANDTTPRLRRMTRRGFAWGGLAALGGLAGWRWVVTRSEEGGLPWPFRRVLELDERVARGLFRPSRLSREFPRAAATMPRVNGVIGLISDFDPTAWRLRVVGPAGERFARSFTLDEIRALPRVEMTTELRCVEGWSEVVHWAGARLADVASATGLAARGGRPGEAGSLLDYASLETPDGDYYVGLDMASALHPQTLLCYEMDGQPLTPDHGAPLRLVIPLKYGIKNLKRVGTIRFTDARPADYWAERGYDWYAGH